MIGNVTMPAIKKVKLGIIVLIFSMNLVIGMEPDRMDLADPKVLEEFLEFLKSEQHTNHMLEKKQSYSPSAPAVVIRKDEANSIRIQSAKCVLFSEVLNIPCNYVGCNEIFATYPDLRKHSLVHAPLECLKCKRLYTSENGYRLHLLKFHGITLKTKNLRKHSETMRLTRYKPS